MPTDDVVCHPLFAAQTPPRTLVTAALKIADVNVDKDEKQFNYSLCDLICNLYYVLLMCVVKLISFNYNPDTI